MYGDYSGELMWILGHKGLSRISVNAGTQGNP